MRKSLGPWHCFINGLKLVTLVNIEIYYYFFFFLSDNNLCLSLCLHNLTWSLQVIMRVYLVRYILGLFIRKLHLLGGGWRKVTKVYSMAHTCSMGFKSDDCRCQCSSWQSISFISSTQRSVVLSVAETKALWPRNKYKRVETRATLIITVNFTSGPW